MLLRFSALLALLPATFAACDRRTKVLVPLYSYSQDCWPELQAAAKAHPAISWILILNPSSGPLVDPKEPALYCVPKLREVMGKNLILIGYVRTGYNDRSLPEVQADVEAYASWKGIEVDGGTAQVDGIFFDETSQTTKDRLDAFKEYTQMCEVDYESAYDTYDISNLPTSPKQLRKSIVMIHDFPSSASLADILKPLVEKKVGGVFVTDLKLGEEDVYSKFGGNWMDFVKGVEELNG